MPHTLLRQKMWARFTDRTVEIFHRGKRVACHVRGSANRRHTTMTEHMPSAHRRFAAWTPQRIRHHAATVGPNAEALVDIIMRSRRSVCLRPSTGRTVTPHPEQGFRSSIGIIRLAKTHGHDRLEAACERALEIGARSYSSVASILRNNLDRRPAQRAADGPAIVHPNIRGPRYFH